MPFSCSRPTLKRLFAVFRPWGIRCTVV